MLKNFSVGGMFVSEQGAQMGTFVSKARNLSCWPDNY